MKRKMSLILLISFIIPLCSCSIGNDGTEPTDATEVVAESTSSQEETITVQEPMEYEFLNTLPNGTFPDEDAVNITTLEYDITPVSEDYSFEEVVDVFLEKSGIDDYSLGDTYQGESEYTPVYYPDYSLVVEIQKSDPYYVPEDYELHTTRTFGLPYLSITVVEYDDPEWAEIGFWGDYNIYNPDRPDVYEILNDDISYGYCFMEYYSVFRARYYLNDCVLIFSCNVNHDDASEQYQIYLDICEELGLPTCDKVTEEILGYSG